VEHEKEQAHLPDFAGRFIERRAWWLAHRGGWEPHLFVNGERILGAVCFEQMKIVIDRQLSRSAHR
jgi:hypothetical protein